MTGLRRRMLLVMVVLSAIGALPANASLPASGPQSSVDIRSLAPPAVAETTGGTGPTRAS
ncbi:hypothetical protein [Allokutzneria oryzae]|uniref:Uncharacterized protein n=1 Tax=Allokutzneria oryzae TaxID=1378989 RepID=A0ABV5ZSC4_9PSEU